MTPAHEKGQDLFKVEPELALAEVMRRGGKMYAHDKDMHLDFLDGYIAARRRRDEHLWERKVWEMKQIGRKMTATLDGVEE